MSAGLSLETTDSGKWRQILIASRKVFLFSSLEKEAGK